jgi:predicted nucleic acid-binding protein
MAVVLVDKSAWVRRVHHDVAAVLDPLAAEGKIASCAITDLEILFSARNGTEHATWRKQRRAFPRLAMPYDIWQRAIEVQGLLAKRGHHRAVPIPDLLLAATAEHHQVALLHYDRDFDLVAAVTGQRTRWIVPAGTVP